MSHDAFGTSSWRNISYFPFREISIVIALGFPRGTPALEFRCVLFSVLDASGRTKTKAPRVHQAEKGKTKAVPSRTFSDQLNI